MSLESTNTYWSVFQLALSHFCLFLLLKCLITPAATLLPTAAVLPNATGNITFKFLAPEPLFVCGYLLLSSVVLTWFSCSRSSCVYSWVLPVNLLFSIVGFWGFARRILLLSCSFLSFALRIFVFTFVILGIARKVLVFICGFFLTTIFVFLFVTIGIII